MNQLRIQTVLPWDLSQKQPLVNTFMEEELEDLPGPVALDAVLVFERVQVVLQDPLQGCLTVGVGQDHHWTADVLPSVAAENEMILG